MARVSPVQNQFTAGELSPRLHGRTDLDQYRQGAATLENFLALPHGGITRRPGLLYINDTKTHTKTSRPIPFQFNVTQAYIIEAGDIYMRFYCDQGRIESPPGTPVEIVTPYLEAELYDLMFAQDADVMYLVHGSHAPRKLTRTSHTAWTLTTVAFIDGPYLAQHTTATTITPSATTGTITLTASTAIFAATDTTGTGGTGDYDRLVRITHGGTTGHATITGFTSATVVTAAVQVTLGDTAAVTEWRLGAWSSTTGFPSAVTFFEQRLCFAGSSNDPQTVWLSKSADFENFTPGTNDDDPITARIAASRVNVIRWLVGATRLFVGTTGGVWHVKPPQTGPVTPSNFAYEPISSDGVTRRVAIDIDNRVLYVQRRGVPTNDGKKLREVRFRFEDNDFITPDLTLLSEHITGGGLVDHDWQSDPDRVLWLARADGALLSFTYNPTELVVAWARHVLTNGTVEGIAAIPGADRDEVWGIVKRTINGATKRYVELLDPLRNTDSALTGTSGSPTTSWTGLDHLEGQTVEVVGDSAPVGQFVVSGGAITLTDAVSAIEAGLPYTSKVETLDFDRGAPEGTALGRPKNLWKTSLLLQDTVGIKVNGQEVVFRTVADNTDMAIPPFTGYKHILSPVDWNDAGRLTITQDVPRPCTVHAIIAHAEVGAP